MSGCEGARAPHELRAHNVARGQLAPDATVLADVLDSRVLAYRGALEALTSLERFAKYVMPELGRGPC